MNSGKHKANGALSLKKQFMIAMQHKIISGELAPGEKLPGERELAEQFGLSRALINNGLSELAAEGFIHVVPRSGNYVIDIHKEGTLSVLAAVMNYDSDNLDIELFDNLMDTRRLIERECTYQATFRGTEEDFRKMERHVEEMQSAPDTDAFCEAVFRFHYNLMQASQNSIYMMIYRGFEPALRTLMWNHYSSGITDRDSYVELHRRLVELLRQGDAVRADECIRSILLLGVHVLRRKYEGTTKPQK